jgi:hypothetical protein
MIAICNLSSIFVIMEKEIRIMNTEQYAKEVYYKYSKTNTASQQRIRKMIKDGKNLPQVIKIERMGNNNYFNLLHVEMN